MTDIHDIKGLIEILPFWQKYLLPLITLGFVLILILSILFIYFRKRNLRQSTVIEPNFTPFEKAMNALAQNQGLMHPGMDKILSTRISDIIRQYIESAFFFPASEKTTEEFLHNIQEAMTFSPKVLETLALFLEMCDLAKFAKIEFTPNEQKALYAKAKSFLELAHEEEPKPITDSTQQGAKVS